MSTNLGASGARGVSKTPAAAAAGADESFSWTWQEKDARPSAATATSVIVKPSAASSNGVAPAPSETARVATETVSVAAYKELLQENLELRKKVTEVTTEKLAAEKQREDLDRRARALEQAVLESTAQLERQQKAKTAVPEDLDKTVEATGKAPLEKKADEGIAAPAERSAGTAVQPGSDLFRQMEQDNFQLKQKLADVEAEKNKGLKAQDEMLKEHKIVIEAKKVLDLQLEKIKTSEKDRKKTTENLLVRMPKMESDLAELQKKVFEKDSALEKKERDLAALKQEFALREIRLIKAERMTLLMDKTKEEVRQVSEKEKRDMHFNMATVYAKEGRFREAEEEYLRALKVDPTDADSHYNLAILYDEEFRDQRRAAMHYRRYLKLRPNASDVDVVKDWLLNLEMGGKKTGAAAAQ